MRRAGAGRGHVEDVDGEQRGKHVSRDIGAAFEQLNSIEDGLRLLSTEPDDVRSFTSCSPGHSLAAGTVATPDDAAANGYSSG